MALLSLADYRAFLRLQLRFLTASGNVVQQAVTLAATSVSITFPRTEPDTYGIVATPNWLTTCAVTARSSTGCTITFGTGAPASATVDVLTFRGAD